MKRNLLLSLVLIFAAVMVACSGTANPTASFTQSTASTETVTSLPVPTAVADQSQPVTLRLAVADEGGRPSTPYVKEFVEQVKTRSGGRLLIEPVYDAGADTDTGFERGTIQHVTTGDMELGLAAARAWDTAKYPNLQPLQAPFLITNDALAIAVAQSDVGTQMLDSLKDGGMVGLALWNEDLRHPFSTDPTKPILAPSDFKGLKIRATPSDVSYQLIRALGGEPVFDDDNYQGAESGLRQGFSLTGRPAATGNIVFFPKYQILFAKAEAFAKLSEAQRAELREAALATQKKALDEHPSETDAAKAWCDDGGTIVLASAEQVTEFEKAAQPVMDSILQDALNAKLVAAIRALKAKTNASAGADACGQTVTQAGAAPAAQTQVWSTGLPPNGVWQVELNADDFVRMGVLRSVAETDWVGRYTLTLKDGKSLGEWHGKHGEYGKCQADYGVVGDVVRFTYYQTTSGGDECRGQVDDMQWRLDDEGLHLHLVSIKNSSPVENKAYLEAKPWQRVDTNTSNETWSHELLPNGAWQVELSKDEIASRGVLKSTAAEMAGTHTWTFDDGNAKYTLIGTDGVNRVDCGAKYQVIKDIVRLHYIGSANCDGTAFDDVQWQLNDNGLALKLIAPQSPELAAVYETKPWKKVEIESLGDLDGCVPACVQGYSEPGPLAEGEYRTKHFFGGKMFVTLKGRWSSNEDSTGEFELNPSGTHNEVTFWEDVYPVVNGLRAKDVPITAAGLVTWLSTDSRLKTTAPVAGKIGNIPATIVDVRIADRAKNDDPNCPFDACILFLGFPQWKETWGIAGSQVQRFYIADVEYGGVSHLFVAMIYPERASDMDKHRALAEPVIASVRVPAQAAAK